MADLALAGYELAGFENVRCPFCTTVLAETLGCTVAEGSIVITSYSIHYTKLYLCCLMSFRTEAAGKSAE